MHAGSGSKISFKKRNRISLPDHIRNTLEALLPQQQQKEKANNRKAVRSQRALDSRVPSAKKFKTKGH